MKTECTLLVDDDSINNYLNKRIIERLAISNEVKVVVNGALALEFIEDMYKNKTAVPEIILLDINMPVMNGFEFLKAYDKLAEKIGLRSTIIMLTTSTNENDINKVKEHQIAGYINKPLSEEKLRNVLSNLTISKNSKLPVA